MLTYSGSSLFREFYGHTSLEETSRVKCKLCGEYGAEGWDEDIGPVCAECEVELSRVGAQLMRLSNHIL